MLTDAQFIPAAPSHAEWLIAVLAPWGVSPHPNFGREVTTAAACWALLCEGRLSDFDALTDDRDDSKDYRSVTRPLRLALEWETQEQGARELQALLNRWPRQDVGGEVAVSLALSATLAEIDEPQVAIDVLRGVAVDVDRNASTFGEHRGTFALARRAVELQLALRLLEVGAASEAEELVDSLRMLNERPSLSQFQPFRASPGTALSGRHLQRDAFRAQAIHATEIKSRLESWYGKLWVEVVRTPQPYLDARVTSKAYGGLQKKLREDFEDAAQTVVLTTRVAAEDPVFQPMYAALFMAQLSADLNGIATHSSSIALLAAQQKGGRSVWRVAEALRLARQTGQFELLRRLTGLVRANGPLDALRRDGLRVLKRAAAGVPASKEDLEVLQASVDLLPDSMGLEALDLSRRLIRNRDDEGLVRGALWRPADRESAWRLFRRASEDRVLDEDAARFVAGEMRTRRRVGALEGREIARLLQGLDWDSVGTLPSWAGFTELKEDLKTQGHLELAEALDLFSKPRGAFAAWDALDGLGLAIEVVDAVENGRAVPEGALIRAWQAVTDAVRGKISEGRKGVHSFGGYDQGGLLVALHDLTEVSLPWDLVQEYLLDASVLSTEKTWMLNALSRKRRVVPESVSAELRAGWSTVMRPEIRMRMFPSLDETLPVSAAGLRAGVVLNVIGREEALAAFMVLASAQEAAARGEAAASLRAFVLGDSADLDVVRAVTLSLTYDVDASVRARAGVALLSYVRGESWAAAATRLVQLLSDEGLVVPMSLLRESGRILSEQGVRMFDTLPPTVLDHPSRLIRKVAQEYDAMSQDIQSGSGHR